MPGLILDLGTQITCPHGGRASAITDNTRTLLDGMPALLVTDSFPIADCPFDGPAGDGAAPRPCTSAIWTAPAARVLVGGRPVLVSTSTGQCLSAGHAPRGAPTTSGIQPRVTAQ
jgi:hypothetical protein